MDYIKFDNNAKSEDIFSGDAQLLESADLNFDGATLEEVRVEGKYVTLKIKNKVNTILLELESASILNLTASSGKKYIIQNVEYATTEKAVFLTFALEKHSDFRFACSGLEVREVEK